MMNTRSILPLALTFAGLTIAAGCNNRRDERANEPRTTEVGHTTTTGANVVTTSNDVAVGRIVASRCAREAACNNVGVDKKYQNTAGCTAKIRSDMKDDLNAKDCPYGVDQKELDECLESIRKEDCNNPIDTISRLGACRTSDMCLKTASANH
jgi:hypothetical protein